MATTQNENEKSMIPYFEWKTIELGPLTIQVWGMWVALGMLLSVYLIEKRTKRLKMETKIILDMTLFMILFGIIFSRLFEVIFYEPRFYFSDPVEIFKIWNGGLSSFGGLFGAVLAFFWFAKRKQIKPMEWIKIADVLSFSALFGWIIGRIGCLFIHDHMGKPCDGFICIQSPAGPRLEMSMLEILSLIPLALLFFIACKKQKSEGWFTSLLFIYYGVIRFVLDFFRATDVGGADARYFGLTPGHYSSLLLICAGIWIWKKYKVKF